MRVVDATTAMQILHRPNPNQATPLQPPPSQAPPFDNFNRPPVQPFERHVSDPRVRDGPPFDRYAQTVDPRTRPIDPRIQAQQPRPMARAEPVIPRQAFQLPPNFQAMGQPTGNPNQEQEKANLIMQVLALSDQQIALLPLEQRQSIMLLKEQIQRGGT